MQDASSRQSVTEILGLAVLALPFRVETSHLQMLRGVLEEDRMLRN